MTTPMKRSKAKATRTKPLAIGYLRVSTDKQVDSGAGLAAQEMAVRAEADRMGWDLELVIDAAVSGGSLANDRAALGPALAKLEAGEADILLVTNLDRMSRTTSDGGWLMERAQREGWTIIPLDLSGVDISTPMGELVAIITLAVARVERQLISQRTKKAMAAKKAMGIHVGRPSTLSDDVVSRMISERSAGATLQAIADGLNADGVPTARGAAAWSHLTVRKVLMGYQAEQIRKARGEA